MSMGHFTGSGAKSILRERNKMRAAIYVRVSTTDQHVESQLYDLRALAAQRGFSVVKEYEDRGISGSKARRPGLDALMADGRRKRFDVVLVAAFDRLARSTKHFLEVIDELNALEIEFVSAREGIDSSSPMGRFFTILVACMAEAEKCMFVERILTAETELPGNLQSVHAGQHYVEEDEIEGSITSNSQRRFTV